MPLFFIIFVKTYFTMVKIVGTGKSKHIKKGSEVEVTQELADAIINNGGATLKGAKAPEAKPEPAKDEPKAEAPKAKKATKKKSK